MKTPSTLVQFLMTQEKKHLTRNEECVTRGVNTEVGNQKVTFCILAFVFT